MFKRHYKRLLQLAIPVTTSQLGHMMVQVADSIMVGRLGAEELAAVSFAHSIFVLILMFGIGISYGITPLVAKADGSKNKEQISSVLKNGFALCLTVGLLLGGALFVITFFLPVFQQPPEVTALAKNYLLILALSYLPFMIFQAFKQFAEGLSHTRQAMVINLISNTINIVLNYLLIFGKFGFPQMGVDGAALATLIARIVMMILMTGFILSFAKYEVYRKLFKQVQLQWSEIRKVLSIGIPSGLQFIFEVGAFSFAAIMMGWLGTTQLAAHQIAINLAAVTYMAASGMSAAATVRVGNQLGQKRYNLLREAGFVAFILVGVFMAFNALIFVTMGKWLTMLYIDVPEVISLASSLLIIAAFFQLSDGIQVVGLGALRGLADVKRPTWITLIAYWVIALPLGYFLGFRFDLGAHGIWIGLLIGLTIAAVFLFWRFNRLSKSLTLKVVSN